MSSLGTTRCTHASLPQRGAINLPVLTDHQPKGQIRKSRNGRRRAVVLAAIQLLIIVHIVLWAAGAFGGRTITPIEPSESMEFTKYGIINAGLVFFALALLSTLVLGRWFCGWGCHVVMLQDFCGWIMKKMGVRPKPFRSRFLIYVPLLLALYMFVMPLVHRWGLLPLDERLAASLGTDNWLVLSIRNVSTALGFAVPHPAMRPWEVSSHFTTTGFWDTFPAWYVAIPFLLICGFGCVYFLGAKGFCTYGCPYGGFFAPLDKLAAGRIRVTDACEGCGHCTAVCTSNVRVHEEVREYGMVVDPGCMKCLDCVSVCPNDALYFGFGKPAIIKGQAKSKPPKRGYDLSLGEEIALALVFAFAFFPFRGDLVRLPLLMSAGVAAVITFLAWKLWRIARDPHVNLHRLQFKLKGSIKPAGIAFAAIALAVLGATAYSGVVNATYWSAVHHDGKVTIPAQAVFGEMKMQMPPEMTSHADRAIARFRLAKSIAAFGTLVPSFVRHEIDVRIAWLHSAKHEFAAAEEVLRENIATHGDTELMAVSLARVLRGQMRYDDALALYEKSLIEHRDWPHMFDEFAFWASDAGYNDRLIALCRKRLDLEPDDLRAMRWLSMALVNTGEFEEAASVIRRTIEIDSSSAGAHRYLAIALASMNQLEDALASAERAIAITPQDHSLHFLRADLLGALGRTVESEAARAEGMELFQKATQAQQSHRH